MSKIIPKAEIANQINKLPTLNQEALLEIIQGMYAGKPLLGGNGLLTQLFNDITRPCLKSQD